MKKNLLLYILLVFLMIINCFLLFIHFSKLDHRGDKGNLNRGNPENFISRELKFNQSQEDVYRKLFEEHRKVMIGFDDKMKINKGAFFNKISSENIDNKTVDSLASLVAHNEKKKDLELFNHFKQIYNICDDSQKKNFQSIIKKALRRNNKKGPPKRRH